MAPFVVYEDSKGNRYKIRADGRTRFRMGADWRQVGVEYGNHDDLEHVFTPSGFMVGNAIKKVTNALGIKQCMKCKGRQRRYNRKGLEIQQQIGNAVRGVFG